MKKWLICGGREAPASLANYVNDVLDRIIILEGRPSEICQGEARGFDSLAKNWANLRRISCVSFKAQWNKYGDGAGPKRNQEMLDQFKPDLVLAFPGGRGTQVMIDKARKAGIKVVKIPTPESLGYRN